MIAIVVMIPLTGFTNIAVVFMRTKIPFTIGGPGMIVVYTAMISIPVGRRRIVLRRDGVRLPAKADQSDSAAVKIDNFSFGPATLSVAAGTTVTWTNNDDVPHTVVSDDKLFKSEALDTDDKFSYTFTKPGTCNYFCSVHPKMTAQIVVR